ncbi:hypothetical protein MHU86_7264 [Fragilaria crotonensis]|nr:hypothetical protein MHU86_7264 [Fragilaria crotonensis]
MQVAKRLKVEKLESSVGREQYVNIEVIPGTSVNCERLFSLAKHILTDTRKNTSPVLFEALLFLKVNRSLWDARTVGNAMGRTRECEEAINYIDFDDPDCGGGASEMTRSSVAEVNGVNVGVNEDDDDEEDYLIG